MAKKKVTKKITIELEIEYDPQNVLFMGGGDFTSGDLEYSIALGNKLSIHRAPHLDGSARVSLIPVASAVAEFLEEQGKKGFNNA